MQSYSNHVVVVLYSKWALTRRSRRRSTACRATRSRPTYVYALSNSAHTHVVVQLVPRVFAVFQTTDLASSCLCSQMLVIPPQMSLYMSLAPEQKLTYPLAGPAGTEAFNGGVEGFEAKSFRGLGVFTSTPYETSDDQDSVQMLQRSTQVGEFYRMSPPAVYDASQRLPSWYMGKQCSPFTYSPYTHTHARVPCVHTTTIIASDHVFVCLCSPQRHHDLRRGVGPSRAHPFPAGNACYVLR